MAVMQDVETRENVSSSGQPAWVIGELPPKYAELASQIAVLQEEAQKFEAIAAVLWQTGVPLVLAVRDLFASLQLDTHLMDRGASYDLSVELEGGRRLLVAVAGSPDGIDRRSPLIAQVLRTLQEDASERDRVVVVSNAYCETPLVSRRDEPVTADALKLIRGLGANVVSTSTLFGIWRYSTKDLAAAKKSVVNLHTQDGGIFR